MSPATMATFPTLACIGTFPGNAFHQVAKSVTDIATLAQARTLHQPRPLQRAYAEAANPTRATNQRRLNTFWTRALSRLEVCSSVRIISGSLMRYLCVGASAEDQPRT